MKTYTKKTTTEGYEYVEMVDGTTISSVPTDPANSDYQAYLASIKP